MILLTWLNSLSNCAALQNVAYYTYDTYLIYLLHCGARPVAAGLGLVRPSLPPFPFPSLSSLPLPLEVGPLNPARGSGERCKLPQWGLERSPSRQTIWCISGPKGAALVATVLCIFVTVDVKLLIRRSFYTLKIIGLAKKTGPADRFLRPCAQCIAISPVLCVCMWVGRNCVHRSSPNSVYG